MEDSLVDWVSLILLLLIFRCWMQSEESLLQRFFLISNFKVFGFQQARPALSQALADGNYDDVVDHRLNGNYDPMEMARMIACAAACVRHSAKRRPKMSQVINS